MAGRRPYRLRKRAERQEETRRRIAEATVALHQEIGPARTTVSAIARRAGVERLTVYRHFPSEADLLRACQQHFLAAHPLPDPAAWSSVRDPSERLRAALADLYGYYQETEAMLAHLLRDAPLVPDLAELLDAMPRYLEAARTVLGAGWGVPDERRPLLDAVLGHALDFETWRSLVRRQGLSTGQAVEVVARMVAGLFGCGSR